MPRLARDVLGVSGTAGRITGLDAVGGRPSPTTFRRHDREGIGAAVRESGERRRSCRLDVNEEAPRVKR